MEIVPIFGDYLFAIKYAGESKDEFSRLFENWQDPEYLEDFFDTNKSDLEVDFTGRINFENAVLETFKYAQEFESQLLELSAGSTEDQLQGLEEIFRPLYNLQDYSGTLRKSKARSVWLRLYALRIDRNIYLVTGGAIKLTQLMQDREHTNLELGRIEKCRQYLMSKGIVDKDGLIEEMES